LYDIFIAGEGKVHFTECDRLINSMNYVFSSLSGKEFKLTLHRFFEKLQEEIDKYHMVLMILRTGYG
jgi:hypothetical protein